jgi:hypothetical protein
MKKRYVFALFAIVVIGLLALSFWLIRCETPAMRELRAKFDAIKMGMTRRQVAELLGRTSGSVGLAKVWWYPEASLSITFDLDGKAREKKLERRYSVWQLFGMQTGMHQSDELDISCAVGEFLDDIFTGHANMAFSATTADFQSRYGWDQFRELVACYPLLQSHSHGYTSTGPGAGPFPPGKPVQVSLTIHDEKNPLSLTLTLKKRGMFWEVDDMKVP